MTPSPSKPHQRLSGRIFHLVQSYLDTHAIGEMLYAPFDVLLSEFNVLEPDLLYISNERAHQLTEQNLRGTPDLAVEILSPGTRHRDLQLKRTVYEKTGVQEYWVVDPDANTIDVFARAGNAFGDPRRLTKGDTLTTPLLPGLELPRDKVLA